MNKIYLFALVFLLLSCEKKSADELIASLKDSSVLESGDADDKPADSPLVTPSMTQEFMSLINDHRLSLGLAPLIHDAAVGKIAQDHSADMASGLVAFGHTGFSARCTEAKSILGGGNWCGENVASGQRTVKAAFDAWMNSSGHRANIEKSRATHAGFGYKQNSKGTYYWTQIFIEVN